MAKANSKLFLVLLLGVLSAFGPFVVDLYLPSLPQLPYLQRVKPLFAIFITGE